MAKVICVNFGGGLREWERIVTEADPVMVEAAYLTIIRGYQDEAFGNIPEDERPRPDEYLLNYRSQEPPDFDYYSPVDYLNGRGEWIRDYNIRKAREIANAQKDRQPRQPRDMI